MIIIPLFAIPAIKTNIGREFTEDELQLLISNVPMYKNEEGMYNHQSLDLYLFNTFAEELKEIKNYCQHQLKQYLEDIEGVDTDITNLSITESWLNKIEPQGFRGMHNHKNSYLSGILYISCLPNDNIQLTEAHRMYDMALELPKKKMTPSAAKVAAVPIKEGDFVVFPSQTLHQVGVNETKDKQRVSLSFDTWPTYLPSVYPRAHERTRRIL